ncbi:WD repeat protein [Ichthyophthirius multifiliis]|uniref:WD repeat protein n=1 Tax=Ichthyophthirius multifiliis TaxID=5932 RepID=G0R2C4_ICHMU|nr:WD repeat protein [Ichthyophthirius multifiliis]EGR28381.1 WD repeat protein [Ichthyophthirius multifiliis]|eukprot:XP_004027726.1 WD repeat protein [Ichthyophthirius multifiliis]
MFSKGGGPNQPNQKLENGISIQLENSFGCYQTPIRKNSYFCTDDNLIYNCGNHLVLYDVVRKKQKYVMKNIEDQPLTAMTFFTNPTKGTTNIAVALKSKSDTLPQVKVYSSQKPSNFSLVHNIPNSIILDIQFILKARYIITLTHMPKGFQLNIYNVQEERHCCIRQVEDQEASKIEVNTKLGSDFIIIGKKYCQVCSFEYQGMLINEKANLYESLNKQFNLLFEEEICEAVWISEYIIIATFQNKLHIFKNLIYQKTLDLVLFEKEAIIPIRNSKQSQQEQDQIIQQVLEQQKNDTKHISVSCMSKFQRGLAIGFQGAQMISLYEFDNQNELVHKGNYYLKEENIQKIHSIDIAPDEMYAVICILFYPRGSHQTAKIKSDGVYAISPEEKKEQQGKLEIYMFNLAVVDAIKSVQKDPFEPLFEQGVHKGSILDLSLCPTRSILVSVCEDKTTKFMDFGSEFRELISQFFHETPNCISIHPLNIQCAIGFKEGIKVFNILDDELKPSFTNNTKTCTAISYSEGGHLLAAGNLQIINIYNPYEYILLYTLNGHAVALKSIEWINNDQNIISICQGGLLNVWDLKTGTRFIEHSYRQHKLLAVAYDFDFDLVVCACSDNKLRIFKEKGQIQVCEHETSPCQFTSIHISKRFDTIIFGTSEGSIRIYLWPFWTFKAKSMDYLEIPIHQCTITSIKISQDYQYLITCSEDSSIFFSKIREFVEGEDVTVTDFFNQQKENNYEALEKVTLAYSLNNLCLCSKIAQEQKKESIKELEFRLQNYKSDIDDEKEKWGEIYAQRIKTLKEKHNDQKQKQKENLLKIQQEYDQKFEELREKKANQKQEMEEIEEKLNEMNSKDLIQCYQRRDELTEKLQNLKSKFSNQIEHAQQQYNYTLKKVQDEYDIKFSDIFNKYKNALENVTNDQHKFHEVLSQQEQDFDTYFTKTKQNLKEELEEELRKTEELRSSNSKYNKEIQNYKERKQYLQQESEQLSLEIKNLELDQKNFEDKQNQMVNQLNEKEDIINMREQQIKDLRSKNIHLQNFQKVYDYQVNTLKDERQPLKEHLLNMEKHVKNLYNELLEESGANKNIDKDIEKTENKTKEMKIQLREKQKDVMLTRRLIENFQFQILDMLKNLQFKEWPKRLAEIYTENFSEKSYKIEKVLEQSTIGANLKELKKDAYLEQIEQEQQFLIGQDLKGQRDFLARQLVKVAGDYRKVMESRNDAYLRVQNMNTLLINECNEKREKKSKLKEYLSLQKKAYREVRRELAVFMGQSLKEILDDDDENINFIQQEDESEEALDEIDEKNNQNQKNNESGNLLVDNYNKTQNSATLLKNNKFQVQKAPTITEKKINQRQLIQDLLKQIELINDNQDLQGDQLKERVQNFLYVEKKDTVGPLIQKEQQNQALKLASSTQGPFFQTNRIKMQSSQGKIPNSPGVGSKTSTAPHNFMQTFTSNLGFGQTGQDFNRKSALSQQQFNK